MRVARQFRKLDIRQSVFLLSASIMIVFLSVGILSLHSLMTFGNRYEDLKNNKIRATSLLHEVDRAFMKLRLSAASYYVGRTTPGERIRALDAGLKNTVENGIRSFTTLVDTPQEAATLAEWKRLYKDFLVLRAQQMKLLEDGREKEFNEFRANVAIPHNKKVEQALEHLIELQETEALDKEIAVSLDVRHSEIVIFVLLLASSMLTGSLAWLSMNWIARLQRESVEALNKTATLGAIAGDIAHEINNPLSVILASAESLHEMIDSGADDRSRLVRSVEKIHSASERIRKVTSGMRAFSRNGSADPFERFDLRQMLDETMSFCADKLSRHGVRLEFKWPSEPLLLEGRAAELSQVMVNLLGNSVDAISNHADRWLRIEVTGRADEIEISFTDSGQGIPANVRTKMFKSSFTTKPVGVGTGLGLTICARIIEAHNGSIAVDPTCENTRIVVRLPVSQQPFLHESAS